LTNCERGIRRNARPSAARAVADSYRLTMKKPKLQVESPQPRQVQRADLAPTTGYAMVVDGHFKTEFVEEKAAKKAATELLVRYPMLKVEIYDASLKSRALVK
jgi:hypothetical protein